MGVPFYLDDDARAELAMIREWERHHEAAQMRGARWSPLTAATLAAWADRAPMVDPEAMLSLARAGVTPDSPAGREIGRAGALDYLTGWRQGEEPSAGARASRGFRTYARTMRTLQGIGRASARREEQEDDDGGGGILGAIGDFVGDVVDVVNPLSDANPGRQIDRASRPVERVQEAVEQGPGGRIMDRANTATDPVSETLRGGFRTGFAALNAPLQEMQGTFREVVGSVRERGVLGDLTADQSIRPLQSDAGIAVEQALSGRTADLGRGFFVDPRSGVAQERYRRELRHGTIDGHVITPGRWIADTFTGLDPGDTGYGAVSGTFDAAVTMGLDPTNWVGGAALRALRPERAFARAGVLDDAIEATSRAADEELIGAIPRGIVPDRDADTFAGWLTHGPGREVVENTAAETDPYTLWRAYGRKLPAQTVTRLADETDPEQVRRLLFSEAKLDLDPQFRYNPPTLSRSSWVRRSLADVPVDRIPNEDGAGFLTGIESMLLNGRVPTEDLHAVMNDALRATNRLDRANVFERGLQTVNRTLVEDFDVDGEIARRLTQWINDDQHATRDRLFYEAGGREVASFPAQQTALVDGNVYVEPRAHLTTEMAPDTFSVPSIREIRRLTGTLRKMKPLLMDANGKLTLPFRMIEGFSTNLWKRTTLLRIAWPVRQVLIDEQLRLAAAGGPSVYRHPVHLLAGMLDSRFEKGLLEAGDDPNGILRASEQFQQTLLNSIPFDSPMRRAQAVWTTRLKGSPGDDFLEGWGRELGQLSADPVTRHLAEFGSVEMTVDELLTGGFDNLVESLARRPSHAIEGDDALRAWVSSQFDRLRLKTGDNPELMEAVRDGYLRGDGGPLHFYERGMNAPSEGFHGRLNAYLDSAPESVKFELDPARNRAMVEMWDKATNTAFAYLGSKPSNILSRNPAFRHHYFEALIDKMPMLSDEAQQRALAFAQRQRTAKGFTIKALGRDIGFGDDLLRRMEEAVARGEKADVDWATADLWAKNEAMSRTQDLLGDLTTKNQIADAARVVMPFGSAWREAMGAYFRLIKHNPLVVYNIAKGTQGAMDSGFFYQDTNDEWVFAYPGSAALMANVPGGPGVPFPLTGRVQGLTMGFEVMPGFGPVAQLPLKWLIPDRPEWDGLRDIVMPYGVEGDIRHIIAPEWLEKVGMWMANLDPDSPGGQALSLLGKGVLGGDNQQSLGQYASSVGDVATYLATTGRYDLSSEAGVDELMRDAKQQAASLWAWRGLAQFVSPSAPRPNPVMEDESGELVVIAAAAQRLQELREQDPLHAGQRFLEEFGDLAFMVLSPKSKSNALYIPGDEAGYDWVRENDNLMERYSRIGALFAPVGGGEAGYAAYVRSIEEGNREAADPTERLYEGQDALATILYNRARDTAMAAAERAGRNSIPEGAQDALREYRQQLMGRYPGYLRDGRTMRDIERTVTDLRKAVDSEDVFRGTEAGEALVEYLDLRDIALRGLRAATDADSLTAQAAAPAREILRDEGQRLIETHPSFINLWERVFQRELDVAEDGDDA